MEVRVSYVTCGLLDQKSRKKLQPFGPVLQKPRYLHPPGSGSSAERTFTPCLSSPSLPFIPRAPLFYPTTLKCLGFSQTRSAEQLSTAEQRRQQRGTDAAGGNRGRGSKRERGEERDARKGETRQPGGGGGINTKGCKADADGDGVCGGENERGRACTVAKEQS